MTRQDKAGWIKSFVILIAGWIGIHAYREPLTQLRIAWSVIGIAFCLVLLKAIDWLFKRQRALGK